METKLGKAANCRWAVADSHWWLVLGWVGVVLLLLLAVSMRASLLLLLLLILLVLCWAGGGSVVLRASDLAGVVLGWWWFCCFEGFATTVLLLLLISLVLCWNGACRCLVIILQQRLEERDIQLRRLKEELSQKELIQEKKDSIAEKTATDEVIQVKTEIEV